MIDKYLNERIRGQRDAFAVLACYQLGKTIEETATVLGMEEIHVLLMYSMIRGDRIDFESNDAP
jgi:hypothetical protein